MMSQIIVTSRYLKSGSASKVKNYVKYIATRETVEYRDQNDTREASATEKQQELLRSLLSDFPEAKKYLEYEDYLKNATVENASELISTIIERNADVIGNRQNFVGYMAMRPGVQKRGSHGLFNESDEPIILDKVANEVANHKGNVWSHVVSLRREDAIRFGYDHSEVWRELVMRHITDIANQTRIPLCDLKWYASFHDTTHHPHIHLIVYSQNPKQGFLSKEGINKIRSVFANDIFHDDLQSIYQQQTLRRDELKMESKKQVENIISQISRNTFSNENLEQLIKELYSQLQNCSGKKVYGYLPPRVKETVNEIFSELSQNENIQKLYEKWCELERQKYKTYTLKEKEFPNLVDNPTFKSVKNMIINQALSLYDPVSEMELSNEVTEAEIEIDDMSVEIDVPDEIGDYDFYEVDIGDFPATDISTEVQSRYYIKWTKAYKSACSLMYKKDVKIDEICEAEAILKSAADSGNILAIHDLAKLYSTEKLESKNEEKSSEYYKKALQGLVEIEPHAHALIPFETKYPNPDPVDMRSYVWCRIGKMHCYGLGTEQNYEKAFDWFYKASQPLSEEDMGNKYAQYSLANLYFYGNGVEKDLSQALHWYKASANQGQPYAAYAVAQFYIKGVNINSTSHLQQISDVKTVTDGFNVRSLVNASCNCYNVDKNETLAQEYFKQALDGFLKLEEKEQADDNLLYKIGSMYKNGLGTDVDMPKAISYFKQSAELINKHGLYEYGKVLLLGEYVEQDIPKALEYLEKSIKLKNTNAKWFLALEHISGEHLERNIEKGITMLTELSDSGDTFSAYRLGKMYFQGEVVPKNLDLAEKYLMIAASDKNEFAQYNLGKLYLTEEKYDLDKAVEWLEMAVKQENEFAKYMLAKILIKEEYRNIPRAVELFKSIADKNNFASYQLGKLYLFGAEDFLKDKELAIKYLTMSAEQGNIYAQNLLEHKDNFESAMISNAIFGLFMNLSRCISDDYNDKFKSNRISMDRKLRSMIQSKRLALGMKDEQLNQLEQSYYMK